MSLPFPGAYPVSPAVLRTLAALEFSGRLVNYSCRFHCLPSPVSAYLSCFEATTQAPRAFPSKSSSDSGIGRSRYLHIPGNVS